MLTSRYHGSTFRGSKQKSNMAFLSEERNLEKEKWLNVLPQTVIINQKGKQGKFFRFPKDLQVSELNWWKKLLR